MSNQDEHIEQLNWSALADIQHQAIDALRVRVRELEQELSLRPPKSDWDRLNRVFKSTSDKTIDQSMEIEWLHSELRAVTQELATIKSPDLRKEKLQHKRNCSAWHSEHGHEINGEDCTCGLRFLIQVQTEQTLHAAWRKRAEEAETSLAAITQELEVKAGALEFNRILVAQRGDQLAQLQARNIKLRDALKKARQHMLDAEFDPECIAVLEIDAALTEEDPKPNE